MLHSLRFKELPSFIVDLVENTNNDELLEIWMSNPLREGNFEEFKEQIMAKSIEKSKTKEQLESEAQLAKNRALEKLKKIDGGEHFGS
ncbi:hypothetical protein [Marinilactibacillus kalidii]|uniref:hypothetical protein n=1 Tax=Marinilactibacillus kalidii TaxID=2820274 RepID=UPI001ABDC589|nr:hypothetical protein [Marinilactibacillus kalidii]